VVWHTTIAVFDDEVAGEIRAVGAARNARPTGNTLCDLAPLECYIGASFMQAAFTGDLFYGYV
jgi:hypothetical protein